MKLSHHSKMRLKERANVAKNSQKQFFINALRKGESANDLKECKLKHYLLDKEKYNRCRAKVYDDFIFIYSKNNKILYTVYSIPKELMKEYKMTKPVYLYDLDGNLLMKFKTTMTCAEFFNYSPEYINHNLKYCDKIRKDGKWYRIRRTKC